jgi:hypothetical protein
MMFMYMLQHMAAGLQVPRIAAVYRHFAADLSIERLRRAHCIVLPCTPSSFLMPDKPRQVRLLLNKAPAMHRLLAFVRAKMSNVFAFSCLTSLRRCGCSAVLYLYHEVNTCCLHVAYFTLGILKPRAAVCMHACLFYSHSHM